MTLRYIGRFVAIAALITQSLYGMAQCDLEREVINPSHVTVEEYQKIQECLRSITDLPPMATDRCAYYFQWVRFVGTDPSETPIFETAYLNNDPVDRRNCIVLYVSYNGPYPGNVYDILAALRKLEFNGHVIYRIGGYPNLENGSLKTIDVPYAFKAYAMQEAYLLGYQNILWLDSSMTPVRDLTSFFHMLEVHGYFAMTSGSNIKAEVDKGWINRQALAAMKINYQIAAKVPHITTPVFGINTASPKGREILKQFCRMAEEKKSFFCDWVDEAPVSAILYTMHLPPLGTWHEFMVKDWEYDGVESFHYFSMNPKRPDARGK